MASFLTALANIGSQYAQGKGEALQEAEARKEKQAGLDIQRQYLDLAREAGERQQAEAESLRKSRDIIELKDGRLWSISQGRVINTPPAVPSQFTALRDFITKQPKPIQGQLTEAAQMYSQMDPTKPEHAIDKVLGIAEDYRKKQQAETERAHKIDPIVAAQVGPYPDAGAFPGGLEDPQYKLAVKKWGIAAETIKNRMQAASGEARAKAFGAYRYGPYIDQSGNIVTTYAGNAAAQGMVPYQPGFQSMTRTQQIAEMQGASSKLHDAITALQPGDAFSPATVVQLRAAIGANDPTTFNSIIDNALAGTLNERQQDYLIWLQQMGERVLSLRNVAGMGQGAQDLRYAIQATLPGITSGSKQFALKRLSAIDNQINILSRGIPRTNINPPGGPTAPAAQPKVKIGKDGSITIE